MNKTDLVRECGYVKNDKVCFTAFYEALLEAKGVELSPPKKLGRKLSHKAKVQFNGNLMVGSAYVEQLGFKPGAEFDIKISRNTITLTAA